MMNNLEIVDIQYTFNNFMEWYLENVNKIFEYFNLFECNITAIMALDSFITCF